MRIYRYNIIFLLNKLKKNNWVYFKKRYFSAINTCKTVKGNIHHYTYLCTELLFYVSLHPHSLCPLKHFFSFKDFLNLFFEAKKNDGRRLGNIIPLLVIDGMKITQNVGSGRWRLTRDTTIPQLNTQTTSTAAQKFKRQRGSR